MRALPIVAAVGLLLALAPATAGAQLNGQIITSDQPLPGPSGTTQQWHKELKKQHKTTFTKGESGWKVHFIAFMRKAAGTNELNVVFYDITKGKPDQVHYIPFTVQPKSTTLQSNFFVSTDTDPIKPNHKYEVRLTRVVSNHEDVLAKVVLTFK